ncbi:MAG: hypothetical protein UT24_C0015G0047 [Candidatus Woesebacteria bacterium GW2011_GWB1_39_12]|uniref:Uncharacterized protein n=1 Tax=Candidatus Woesebacteria bacterium GW2011_GWB1_39_12 TaxID=1618574 RepID=A0A0G0M7Y6_9BACT|nr:MAG: hypothetical protein UT24_C0015G0047 [Candidatus Woesebacteria bacterium GW2011_GWB1_39_12]
MEWTFNGLTWRSRPEDFPALPLYSDYDRRLGYIVDSGGVRSYIKCLEEETDPGDLPLVVHRPFMQRLRKVVFPFVKHWCETALRRMRFIYWSSPHGNGTLFCRTERWKRPVGACQSMPIWKCKKILNQPSEGEEL